MNKSYRNLIRNSLWALAGNTGSKILSFLLLPFYTRWLGTAGYGLSDLITTYSSFLLGVVTLCAADGIFIFTKNRTQTEKSEYFTSTLKFVSVLLWGGFLSFQLLGSWHLIMIYITLLRIMFGLLQLLFYLLFAELYAAVPYRYRTNKAIFVYRYDFMYFYVYTFSSAYTWLWSKGVCIFVVSG